LNEVAPRPHNSGHHTIESCYTSQYEQHLRAILGIPLGDPSMKTPAAIMYNILGEDEVDMIPYSYVHVSSHFGLYLGRSPCSYL
jgi:phosphoribosylaminoimidazole carboxylase